LASDGGFSAEETFHPLEQWDGEAIMKLFRRALLELLVAKHAISEELQAKLLGWRHPGFSIHVGEPIPPNDPRAIEDMASYVVRNPVSLKRLVYIDGEKAVIYRALKPNPRLGANFVALDPVEWLARVADHIPDPGKHRTLFYSHYANRARGARAKAKKLLERGDAESLQKSRCSPSWARLIAKVYSADPLTCRQCGGPLQIVAYIHDHFTIKTILEHLGWPTDSTPRSRARQARGASRKAWCVADRRGRRPPGSGGRTRRELRGVDPCPPPPEVAAEGPTTIQQPS
jgi:hypothetical protein